MHVPRASTGSFLGIWSLCPAIMLPADFLPWLSGALLLRCEQIHLPCVPLSPVPVWLYPGAPTWALLCGASSVLCGLAPLLLAWPSHTSSLNSGAMVAPRVSKLTDHYSVGSSKCAVLGSPSDLGNFVCVWCCLHCEHFEVHCIQMMVLMLANSLLLIPCSVFTVC